MSPDGKQGLGEVGEFELLADLLVCLADEFTRGIAKVFARSGKFYCAHYVQSTVNNLWLAQTTPGERKMGDTPLVVDW